MSFPERIVCLAAEVPEILYRLGVLDKVVGISAYTTRPEAALGITRVSGFQSGSIQRILSLEPDIVILTSDVQKELAAKLATAGATLIHFNSHRFDHLYDNIKLLGNIVNRPHEAEKLNQEIQETVEQVRRTAAELTYRPRVYFEEWMDPHLCGTGWVSDLIELAGGEDVFRQKSINGRNVEERVVTDAEILGANPDVVLASWCGKPFQEADLSRRPGYSEMKAVQRNNVYELSSEILQFGPMLLDSLRELSEIFQHLS